MPSRSIGRHRGCENVNTAEVYVRYGLVLAGMPREPATVLIELVDAEGNVVAPQIGTFPSPGKDGRSH